jgi:hypothetical protein
MTRYLVHVALLALLAFPFAGHASDPQRRAEVANRGAEEMPFRLKVTTHIFTRTGDGGTQRVVATRENFRQLAFET